MSNIWAACTHIYKHVFKALLCIHLLYMNTGYFWNKETMYIFLQDLLWEISRFYASDFHSKLSIPLKCLLFWEWLRYPHWLSSLFIFTDCENGKHFVVNCYVSMTWFQIRIVLLRRGNKKRLHICLDFVFFLLVYIDLSGRACMHSVQWHFLLESL